MPKSPEPEEPFKVLKKIVHPERETGKSKPKEKSTTQ